MNLKQSNDNPFTELGLSSGQGLRGGEFWWEKKTESCLKTKSELGRISGLSEMAFRVSLYDLATASKHCQVQLSTCYFHITALRLMLHGH